MYNCFLANVERKINNGVLPCIQLAALDLLKSSNPNGRFWIKIDATDIKHCIMESQRKVWNGDEDLGDGKLAALRDEYEDRMADMHRLKSRNAAEVKEVIPRVLDTFTDDITFLDKGFKEAADHFEKKSRQANCPEETLKEANWEVVEYQILLQQSQELHQDFENALASLADMTQADAILPTVHSLATSSFVYLRSIFKKKRTAATHVLVLMLSDERRAKKPYALPVRYVPCRTLKDQFIRDLTKDLKQEMRRRDLYLTGNLTKLFEPFPLWKSSIICVQRDSRL